MWSTIPAKAIGAVGAAGAAAVTYMVCKATDANEAQIAAATAAAAVIGEGVGSGVVNAMMSDPAGACETAQRVGRKAAMATCGIPPVPGI